MPPPYERGDVSKILPLALQYLTPHWVSVLGTTSVCAAVMSSMDSVLLSSASMFTQNIYKSTLRKGKVCGHAHAYQCIVGEVVLIALVTSVLVFSPKASERELQWVIRTCVVVVGATGMGLSLFQDSVYNLFMLSMDLMYCMVTPQLFCVLYCRHANVYGAMVGYVVPLLLRFLGGEPLLGLPCVILYPGWKEEDGVIRQYFPYKTMTFLIALVCIPVVSYLARLCFTRSLLPLSWDVLRVFRGKDQAEGKAHDMVDTRL